MFRLVDRTPNFRQRASQWISKMLFLWSRQPAASPRAGPWLAWLATAFLLWRCRRRIIKAIFALSSLRLMRKGPLASSAPTAAAAVGTAFHSQRHLLRHKQQQRTTTTAAAAAAAAATAVTTPGRGIRTRVKRLCTGDGPHVSGVGPALFQTSTTGEQQIINYRVTRSGRVYGRYPYKIQ